MGEPAHGPFKETQRNQRGVYNSIYGEEGLEDHGRTDQTGRTRQKNHRSEYALELELGIIEKTGQDKGHQEHDGNLDNQIGDYIAHRSEKHLVFEEPGIVLEPCEFQVVPSPRLQREQEGTDHRIEVQDENEECRGDDEQPAVQVDFLCQCGFCHDAFPLYVAFRESDTASIQRYRSGE
ncbi:hypothetical protein SDC9_112589 [bioreactor metagenome]|uniref:Uncharacterized protein n=1 Tax=bioreactor metagenome TaxID=1076179 RepID=A0A645BKF9_9ZZZZ